MTRRIFCAVLVFILTFSLAACGQAGEGATSDSRGVGRDAGEETEKNSSALPEEENDNSTETPAREAAEENSGTAPEEYEYITQELYAQRGENQIYGVIYIP